MDCYLESRIRHEAPDLMIVRKDGQPSDVQYVRLNDDGYVTEAFTYSEHAMSREKFDVHKYVLDVPGVGLLTPGTRVVYKDKDYVLLFGWHTNMSNQRIFTWYLEPLVSEDCIPLTLYQEMIDEIDIVHFR